ncbi:hypothetical protein NMY22_g15782 [Coprinellus aureogranulatus]|nr:hypothetical protein NMY22_g15782 [Coprinellus aureogranulatus]
MSDTANESTGNFEPTITPVKGDDGYVPPDTTHYDEIAAKDPSPKAEPTPRINAADLRSVMGSTCDLVAGWCDWNRDLFAKELVGYCRGKWGEFNWVICHPAHSYLWMGARGVDWEHWHYELDIWGPGTVGYELYWAREGVFTLNGDGGFINWAYIGNVQQLNNKTLYFKP